MWHRWLCLSLLGQLGLFIFWRRPLQTHSVHCERDNTRHRLGKREKTYRNISPFHCHIRPRQGSFICIARFISHRKTFRGRVVVVEILWHCADAAFCYNKEHREPTIVLKPQWLCCFTVLSVHPKKGNIISYFDNCNTMILQPFLILTPK